MAMNALTPVTINYKFKVPAELQSQAEPRRSSGAFLPKNDFTSGTPLAGRVNTFLEFLGHIDRRAIESFIEIPLRAVPAAQELPFLTSGATSTEDNIANISYFIRTLMPEAVSTQAVGVTTGENVFQGLWAAVKSIERFKWAREIGDTGGMIEGGTDVIRGASQSAGGAAYLGYRAAMIPADIQNLDTSFYATTFIGKSAFVLGTIGNIFFTVFYVMIALWSAYGFAKDWQFSIGMKAHEGSGSHLYLSF